MGLVLLELTVQGEGEGGWFKYKGRTSYPGRMGEWQEPLKASWRQEHHLKDEEASINTTNKYKGAR